MYAVRVLGLALLAQLASATGFTACPGPLDDRAVTTLRVAAPQLQCSATAETDCPKTMTLTLEDARAMLWRCTTTLRDGCEIAGLRVACAGHGNSTRAYVDAESCVAAFEVVCATTMRIVSQTVVGVIETAMPATAAATTSVTRRAPSSAQAPGVSMTHELKRTGLGILIALICVGAILTVSTISAWIYLAFRPSRRQTDESADNLLYPEPMEVHSEIDEDWPLADWREPPPAYTA